MGDPYPGKVKYEGGKAVTLTWQETVASLALGGWPESLWVTAAAVVDAESSRAINIYNTYLEGHWGLMQIGKKQHPAFFAKKGAWLSPWDNCAEGYRIYKSQGWGAWEAKTNGRYSGGLVQATAAVNAVKIKRNKSSKSGPEFYKSLFRPELLEGLIFMGAVGGGQEGLADSIAGAGEITGGVIADSGEAVAAAAASQAGAITGGIQLLVGAARWIADPGSWIRVVQVLAGGALLVGGIAIVAKPLTGVTPAGLAKKTLKAAKGPK